MDDRQREEDEERERRRPRVVDKRISARESAPTAPAPQTGPAEAPGAGPEASPPPQAPRPKAEPPPASVSAQPPPTAAGEEPIWTPEQEAQARQMMKEIAEVSSLNWVVQLAMELVNVASVKLNAGLVAEASLPIDALAAIVAELGPRLEDAEAPMRQTLAQLQMTYAQMSTAPPQQGAPGS